MKFLLIDDHALFREGMVSLLNRFDEDVVVLQARGFKETMQVLAEHPDLGLVLLDLKLKGEDGTSILKAATQHFPTVPIAVLSASTNQSDVDNVMRGSAMGFIPKDTSPEILFNAIRIILAGELYVPASLKFKAGVEAIAVGELTERQAEVLAMMTRGLSNKIIAAELCISLATVKMHVTAIFRHLGVSNRTQAVLKSQGLN